MSWKIDWNDHDVVELLRNVVAHALRWRPTRLVNVSPEYLYRVDEKTGKSVFDPRLKWIWLRPFTGIVQTQHLGSLTLRQGVSLFEGRSLDDVPNFTGETANAIPTPFSGLYHCPPFVSYFPHDVLAHLFVTVDRDNYGAVVAK